MRFKAFVRLDDVMVGDVKRRANMSTAISTSTLIAAPETQNQAPTAVINGPTSGVVEEVLSYDGSGSRDSDGSIASYEWNFGDGSSGSGEMVSHTYSAAGSYPVRLTVTDQGALSGSTTLDVQVAPAEERSNTAQAIAHGY